MELRKLFLLRFCINNVPSLHRDVDSIVEVDLSKVNANSETKLIENCNEKELDDGIATAVLNKSDIGVSNDHVASANV